MSTNWKITASASRPVIEAALLAHEDSFDWDNSIILAGFEIADSRPEEWLLEAFLPRRPNNADRAAIASLFVEELPDFVEKRLPDEDWVALSQAGLTPITAGEFVVHTPDHAVPDELSFGKHVFCIPASRAFGTGHHATTAGCLQMLSTMRQQGMLFRNIADIGTGTGLLAFAAMHLWPRALVTASDIDPACIPVLVDNAARNAVHLGARGGELTMVIANGMEDPLLAVRAPYDLIIANILAGPLIDLAQPFARALIPGGSLLLAGLLTEQEARVRQACRRAGLRLAQRIVAGDWSILWLRKRALLPNAAAFRRERHAACQA